MTESRSAAPNICGDGIRADAEECDDHNLTTDDGCDGMCHQQYLDEIEPNDTLAEITANGALRPGFILPR